MPVNLSFDPNLSLVVFQYSGDVTIEEHIQANKQLHDSPYFPRYNKRLNIYHSDVVVQWTTDDFFRYRDKLKKQVNFLDKNPDCAIVGTAMIVIDEKGRTLRKLRFPTKDRAIRKHILTASQIAHPSFLLRRKHIEEIGYYSWSKKYGYPEDYDLILRLGTKYKLSNLPDFCLKYRIHPGSESVKNQFRQRLISFMVSARFFNYYPGKIRAFLVRLITFPIPRSLADYLQNKNSLASKVYSLFTGIRRNEDSL